MRNNLLEFCFLEDYSSLEIALKELLGVTKSFLKKGHIQKNYLKGRVKKREVFFLPIDVLNHGQINPTFIGSIRPKILRREKHLLALSKPSCVHTHPHSYSDQENLLSYLREAGESSYLEVNKENYDRGLLYRLDYETSGLILLSCDEKKRSELRSNFKKYVKNKVYLAIVGGELKKSGHYQHFVRYKGEKKAKGFICQDTDEMSQELNIEIEKMAYNQEKNCSLVRVNLQEGRRHQVRIQLSALGHPILGDLLYGNTSCERLFLHCYEYTLSFEGEDYYFKDESLPLFNNFFDLNRHF